MSKKDKKILNFPKKIIVFKNIDKKIHEKWSKNRDLLNYPCPARITIAANPNSGKTNMIKNILIRAKPPYKKIFLLHYDPETKEYDDIPEIVKLDEIPDPKDDELFDGVNKTCLIIDDQEYRYKSKEDLKRLDRLFGYTSTHRFTTIITACQDFFNLPSICRRSSDVFIIWKGSADIESLYYIGRKFGYNKYEFKRLFKHCENKYDNITFDLTTNTIAPIRKNGYETIEKPKEE